MIAVFYQWFLNSCTMHLKLINLLILILSFSGNLTKAEDSKDITPLIFEVKDKNGSNLHKTSTVTVGDELNLVVKMQNNAGEHSSLARLSGWLGLW